MGSHVDLLRLMLETVFAGFIGPAFAMLFAVPRRYLPWIALGAMVTRFLRTFLVMQQTEIVVATFFACAVTSMLFILIAPRLQVPRPVFTVASIIPLIPGMDAYNALISMMSIIDGGDTDFMVANLSILFQRGLRCGAIMLAIALGIAVPPLFFYKYRHAHH